MQLYLRRPSKMHSSVIEWPTAPQINDHIRETALYPSWKSDKNCIFRQIYPSCKVTEIISCLTHSRQKKNADREFKDPVFLSPKLFSIVLEQGSHVLADGGDGGDIARGQRIQLSARVLRESI